jgi:hypothetical protein
LSRSELASRNLTVADGGNQAEFYQAFSTALAMEGFTPCEDENGAHRKTRKAIRNSGITALSLKSAGGTAMFSQIQLLREHPK